MKQFVAFWRAEVIGVFEFLDECEEACPQGAIIALNFPPRKPKEEVVPTSGAEVSQPVITES